MDLGINTEKESVGQRREGGGGVREEQRCELSMCSKR